MNRFSSSLLGIFHSLSLNRELIFATTKREILSRYKGSVLGLAWSFVFPVIMLIIYTFVFSEIFKARWSTTSDSKTEFALVLYVGLIIFSFFAECINRAPSIILANSNYVKKVVYPLEILPWVIVANALFHSVIGFVVWAVAFILLIGTPSWTWFFLPFIIAPLLFFTAGICWILASLGVYLRDIGQIIGVFTTGLMFLSPIFFPAEALPEKYRFLLFVNPLTPVIESTRDILYWAKLPNFYVVSAGWILSLLVAWLGFAWFQRTREGFSDVM
jgi:lipopolysaccharide transport system permease protein